jgi:DNA (cytosine-5)-methyltransferase 1
MLSIRATGCVESRSDQMKAAPLRSIENEPVWAKIARLQQGGVPRVLDLFSGCGGLSLGFQRAGFAILAGLDSDPQASASRARNFHAGCPRHALPQDLTDLEVTPENVFAGLGLGRPDESVDVVVGGPPCQAFARIGRAKLREIAGDPEAFLKDPRADLHERWVAWVRELKPLVVLVENIPDVLNAGGRNIAEEIAVDLEVLGFVSRYTLLNAVHYGVPQTRERMFLIGLRRELDATPAFPDPTHSYDVPRGYEQIRRAASRALRHDDLFRSLYWQEPPEATDGLRQPVTAKQAIGDLPPITSLRDGTLRGGPRRFDAPCGYRQGGPSGYARDMRSWPGFEAPADGPCDHVIRYLPRDWRTFERMRPGDEYPEAHEIAEMRFREELKARREAGERVRKRSRAWEDLRRRIVPPYRVDGFPNKWWKLYSDRPSRTLMAHLGKDSYSHIHFDDHQARTISVREAARLQSFPDGFVFAGSMNAAFRQIGNAVPPLLAYQIGLALKSTIQNTAPLALGASDALAAAE